MKLRKRAVQGVKLATPVVAIAREGAGDAPAHGDVAVLRGEPGATARLREILGAPTGTADGAHLLVAAPDDGTIGAVAEASVRRREAGRATLVVLVGPPDVRRRHERELTRGHRVEPSQILHVNDLEDGGADAAADAVVRALGDDATAAARRNPALRSAVGRVVVADAARRAALVGALPLAGADLPALALLQIRMVARLSATHDRGLGPERVLEAIAIVAAGFGWRALGRASARMVPGMGWAAGGAVAYAGTRAVGEAALARFAAGHDPSHAGPLDKVRPQFDRLLSRLARD